MISGNVLKKAHHTPPRNKAYSQPTSKIEIGDAFSIFANPNRETKKEIVLIKPPILFSKNAYSTPITMPLGLAYMASVLDKAQFRVRIIDCPGLGMEEIRLTQNGKFKIQGIDVDKSLELIGPNTDIIGVSIMFSQEWSLIRDYIKKIRQKFPHTTIIVGGEHPTAMPEYTLRDSPAIDYLVLGEGELTLLELVFKLRTKQSIHDVSGIAYLKEKQFIKTGLAPRMANIKAMPWPKWDLIDVEPYFQPNFTMGIAHGRNIGILATRGCPYQCTFCSNPTMWTTRYTMRPVEDVVDEIQTYIKIFKVNSIDFYDLTAIVKKDWILNFAKELHRREIQIIWQLPSGTRSENIDEEVISALANSGCQFLVYAPESGSKKTLEMVKKRVNLNNLQKSVSIALRYGINVKVNFIIGFPFETRQSMWKTLSFVWKLALMKTDDANIATFTPYPGSEMFDELNKENVFGEINDLYFDNLITQFDFTVAKTFSRHVPSLEVFLYRIIGMSVFYALTYLRVPSRLFRLFGCLFSPRQFQPRSAFEQRIYDMIARKRKDKLKAAAC